MRQTSPVQKGKQSRSGQAERRQRILDYIRENGKDREYGVKSGEICSALGLSRSSLSDDLRAISAQGEILISPKGGYYKVNPEHQETAVRPKINRQALRHWSILAYLSANTFYDSPAELLKSPEFSDILEALNEMGVSCSEATLHSDLKHLESSGYLTRVNIRKKTCYTSTALFSADNQGVRSYFKRKESSLKNARTDIEAAASLEEKLRHILPEDFSDERSGSIRSAGKKNLLTAAQLKDLEALRRLDYEKNRLKIVFKTRSGGEKSCCFSVGMIVYSVETGRIYLLGKSRQLQAIPLDRILFDKTETVKSGPRYNYLYRQKEFREVCSQALNISTDPPVQVKVRFRNLPYVREKVDRLQQIRSMTAAITVTEDQKEFIYTDTIRGISDFARYLRRFGRAALAEEPMELKEMMIDTCRKVAALYEEEEE